MALTLGPQPLASGSFGSFSTGMSSSAASVTFNNSTSVFSGATLVNGQIIILNGTVPTGGSFVAGGSYFVITVSGSTFQLSATSGGSALTGTSTGSGLTITAVFYPAVSLLSAAGTIYDPATLNTALGSPMQTTGGTVTANAGTNLNTSALALETGGNLASIKTNTAITAAGTPATSGLPVQGMTGGTPVPVSAASLPLPSGAATAALQPTAAAQGSTTSGQTGHLIQGAVTTSAPSYTTGQTSPLSLDPAGAVRVNVTAGSASGNVSQSSTTSGNTGPMIQGSVTTGSPTYTTAQTNPLSLTTAGALRTDSSATTQPISAASLPLPSGAATATGLSTINTTLGSPMQAGGSVTANAGTNLNTSLLAVETGGNLASIKTNTAITLAGTPAASGSPVQGMTGGVPVPVSGTFFQATQPVSAASLPLPTNAAIETGGNLASILTAAQGAIPAGAITTLIGGTGGYGAVTTGAPTYSTGTNQLLSIDTAGNLRTTGLASVAQGSTTSGQTGNLAQAATIKIPSTLTTATTNPLSTNLYGGLYVSNQQFYVILNPNNSASAYAAGNCVWGLQNFQPNSQYGKLVSASLTCKSSQPAASFKLYFFAVNPTSSTFTDNAAPSVNTGDLGRCLGYITFTGGDVGLGNSTTVWNSSLVTPLGLFETIVYVVMVTVSPITFGSTTDLTVSLVTGF